MPKAPEPSGPSKDPRPRKTGPATSGASGRPSGGATGKAAGGAKPAASSTAKKAAAAAPRPAGRADGDSSTGTRPALTSRAAVLALLVCVIALSLAYPLREYIAQRSEIAQLQEDRARTTESVQELAQRYEELQDPAHIEREARSRLHYQYPDERAYVVIDGDGPAEGAPEDSVASDPWFTQLWKSVLEADKAGTPSDQ